MRMTRFVLDGDDVRAEVQDAPPWEATPTFDGQDLRGVSTAPLDEVPRAEIQYVRIEAGGHFVMHTSPDLAFCQVIHGRGLLRLPDGTELAYEGPELFVFHPGSLHEWDRIEEDTLLSNCLVRSPQQR
ncbi:hypothetical protein FTX61_12760 [Nitriliruptoraceae bacterium ZYF776]|nr:hypothetical protein [Profundirhabdus halotolerans]